MRRVIYPGEWELTIEACLTFGIPKSECSGRDLDRDVYYWAPDPVREVYRWLPRFLWWSWETGLPRIPFYLCAVSAFHWFIGWLPKTRARGEPCRLGILLLDDWRIAI